MGRHTRLLTYLKNPKEHPILAEVYGKNKEIDLPARSQMLLARKRYKLIRRSNPTYIRTIHENNHQRNLIPAKNAPQNLPIIQKHFRLNW